MDKLPFSVYDFFAYLSSGAVIVAAGDYVFRFGLLTQRDIAPVLAVELVVVAYVFGHVVAHFSSWFFEQVAVGRFLGRPASILLGATPQHRLLRWIFPNYFRPLPASTQERVNVQARNRGCASSGEALFLHAYATLTGCSEKAQARLDDFRNQYGFARNMSFAFLISAVAIFVGHRVNPALETRWAACAGVVGVALFYRYLKFFRQYSYDLLLRYAELAQPGSTNSPQGGA
jgi:hypothetical protein